MPISMRAVPGRTWRRMPGPDARAALLRPGYSLLEVLLAVALVALAGAITAPALISGLERREARLALTALEAGVSALRYQAVLSAAPLHLEAGDLTARFPSLPPGWSVTAQTPLRLSAGGLCDGEAWLVLSAPDGGQWRRRAAAPACALEREG